MDGRLFPVRPARLGRCLELAKCLIFLCSIRASSASIDDVASWMQVQADHSMFPYLNGTGVTLFPFGRTVPGPHDGDLCRHTGGLPLGTNYTLSSQIPPVTSTDFVARLWIQNFAPSFNIHNNSAYILGKTSGDGCAYCNNTCPCNEAPSPPVSYGTFLHHNPGDPFWPIEYPAALFMQDGNSFDLSPQSRSTNGTSAGINTVYQILLQPEPGIGFEWVWRQMDEDYSQLYTINGSVPCCIPISPALGDAIFADNSFGSEYYNDSSSSWREYVKEVDGQILGQCNVTTQTATLSWYAITYQLTASNGSLDAYLLGAEWDNTTLKQPPPVAPQGPNDPPFSFFEYSSGAPYEQKVAFKPQWKRVNESNLPYASESDFPSLAVTTPDRCSLSPDAKFPPGSFVIDPFGVPVSYLPADGSWYVGAMVLGTTLGRPQTNAWTLGRVQTTANKGDGRLLAKIRVAVDGKERHAAEIKSPPEFSVLTYDNTSGPLPYHYEWGSTTHIVKIGTYVAELNGQTPCCIDNVTIPGLFYTKNETVASNSRVKTYTAGAQIQVGSVMGSCDFRQRTASITWQGKQYAMPFDQGRALYVVGMGLNVPRDYTGAILGGVLGGIALLTLLSLGCWSYLTYAFRAQKHLFEDQVYSLVIGARSDNIYGLQLHHSSSEAHVDVDRFFNLLPFNSRMPRNQFFADLSSKVAHECLSSWSGWTGRKSKTMKSGIFIPRFEGKEPEALAFAIMKYDTMWSSTPKAIIQQWRRGRRGRAELVTSIESLLMHAEVVDFLDGLDGRFCTPASIDNQGVWPCMQRLFCFSLPTNRTRVEEVIAAQEPIALGKDTTSWDSSLDDMDKMAAANVLDNEQHAKAMEKIMHELELDDWQIKPNEIEIMKNPEGLPWSLGQGAFGQVWKARWNGVQVVAVKQLRSAASQKAQLDFMREVAVLKRLRAENIVRLMGVCVQEGNTMIITEFMSGGDLWSNLKDPEKSKELAWHKRGHRVAVDMARGLAFLHSRNIIHFDLKSPNILCARDWTAKIADVGLAKFMTSDHFTQVTTMGTLAWAAPELLRGNAGLVSTKADMYSFGVVLWELVTADYPRFGQQWYRAPRVPEECPQWVADLISSCMAEHPDERPTSKDVYQRLMSGEALKPGASLPATSSMQ